MARFTHVPMRSEGVQELVAEYRLCSDGDAWGETMHWWFVIADEIHFNRDDLSVPSEWQFRPSPMGPSNEEDDYAVNVVRDASDEDLVTFGGMMNRLASILKASGRDY